MTVMLRTIFVAVASMLIPYGGLALETSDSGNSKNFRMHIQLKPFEYCMGSTYHGTLAIQGGGRVEAFLAGGAIIPEVQYHLDFLNMGRLLETSEEIKPFTDFKAGIKFGITGYGNFRHLRCIDRAERDDNTVTTYYEREKVSARRNFGITAGLYMYRSYINPFTKVSEKLGVTSFQARCLYLGLAKTMYIDGKAKEYASGNVCTWDHYSYWYGSFLYALNYELGATVYHSGSPESLFSSKQHLRPFNRTGFLIGYENGRMLKGFIANFELGAVPALKGKGVFFKVGAGYVIGF